MLVRIIYVVKHIHLSVQFSLKSTVQNTNVFMVLRFIQLDRILSLNNVICDVFRKSFIPMIPVI